MCAQIDKNKFKPRALLLLVMLHSYEMTAYFFTLSKLRFYLSCSGEAREFSG